VRLLRERENRGPAAARNAALAAARGDLITFLDADDLMTTGRLRFQVDYLTEHGDVDVVVGTEQLKVHPGVDLPAWTAWPEYSRTHYCQMSMMARRALFDGVGSFDESFRLSSDTEWTLRAEALGVRTAHVDRVLVVRRIHGGNLTYETGPLRHAMRRALLKSARVRLQRQGGAS
jgi:glycosyltransferase involved in cell wall biosynthesis